MPLSPVNRKEAFLFDFIKSAACLFRFTGDGIPVKRTSVICRNFIFSGMKKGVFNHSFSNCKKMNFFLEKKGLFSSEKTLKQVEKKDKYSILSKE